MRFTLTRPIRDDAGRELQSLELRDHILLGDMLSAARAAEADPVMHDMTLVARLAGVSPMVIEQLDLRDWNVLHGRVMQLKMQADGSKPAQTQTASAPPSSAAPAPDGPRAS